MRQEIMYQIKNNKDLQRFIREQPIWYRKLSRNPAEFNTFKYEALKYFRKTVPDRIEKFSNGLQMATMMMNMFHAMNNNEQS